MEAKVDIKKLQLLNDRIVQTIEALNQVRASVYGTAQMAGVPSPLGMQHTSAPFAQQLPLPGIGYPGIDPRALIGLQQYPGVFGLQHSVPAWQSPSLAHQLPFSPSLASQFASSYGSSFANPMVAPSPYAPTGFSHTSADPREDWFAQARAADVRRIAQTFPYAFFPQGF